MTIPKPKPSQHFAFPARKAPAEGNGVKDWEPGWWVTPMSREEFMATAYAKHPTVTPPVRNPITMSPGGHRD